MIQQYLGISPDKLIKAGWETLYMVIVSTVISYAIGLPLGLTLVVTDKGGIRPMPLVNTVLAWLSISCALSRS